MKHLILVRHGNCGHDNHLDDCGRRQIERLARMLQRFTNDARIQILTSTADRARESAEILGRAFDVGIEEHKILWSESSHPEDLPGTLQLIRSRMENVDVLILVTHYEYVRDFPGYFMREELGIEQLAYLIEKGDAWVIDCAQKTLLHID